MVVETEQSETNEAFLPLLDLHWKVGEKGFFHPVQNWDKTEECGKLAIAWLMLMTPFVFKMIDRFIGWRLASNFQCNNSKSSSRNSIPFVVISIMGETTKFTGPEMPTTSSPSSSACQKVSRISSYVLREKVFVFIFVAMSTILNRKPLEKKLWLTTKRKYFRKQTCKNVG